MQTTPRIFYHAYCDQDVSGGQKQTYRHVEALRTHGYEAYVYHSIENYRLEWFANSAPIVGPQEFAERFDPEIDVFVIPETLVSQADTSGFRRVIFNKNLYYGFGALESLQQSQGEDPYLDPSLLAVFVVSEHNRRNLAYCYPDVPIINVRNGIDRRLFSTGPEQKKKAQIAVTAKDMARVQAILACLRSRDCVAEIRLLSGLTEAEVSACLRESAVLLHCSTQEGLPTIVLEALFSGCEVVAPRRGPLSEILPDGPELDFDEPSQIADHLWTLLRPEGLPRTTSVPSADVMGYTREAEADLVAATWRNLIGAPR